MLSQVPLVTYFHALPWWSVFEVPTHVVPAPAAQSLSPLGAIPKHFSLVGRGGFGAAAVSIGSVDSAVAKALAMALALTEILVVMKSSSFRWGRPRQALSHLSAPKSAIDGHSLSSCRVRAERSIRHGIDAGLSFVAALAKRMASLLGLMTRMHRFDDCAAFPSSSSVRQSVNQSLSAHRESLTREKANGAP